MKLHITLKIMSAQFANQTNSWKINENTIVIFFERTSTYWYAESEFFTTCVLYNMVDQFCSIPKQNKSSIIILILDRI